MTSRRAASMVAMNAVASRRDPRPPTARRSRRRSAKLLDDVDRGDRTRGPSDRHPGVDHGHARVAVHRRCRSGSASRTIRSSRARSPPTRPSRSRSSIRRIASSAVNRPRRPRQLCRPASDHRRRGRCRGGGRSRTARPARRRARRPRSRVALVRCADATATSAGGDADEHQHEAENDGSSIGRLLTAPLDLARVISRGR